MSEPFDAPGIGDHFAWATVHSASPVTLIADGDPEDTAFPAARLGGGAAVAVNQRVLYCTVRDQTFFLTVG